MGKGKDFRDQLERENDKSTDKMRIAEGFDEAIMGYSNSWDGVPNGKLEFIVGRPRRAVYDRARGISIIEEKDEVSKEEGGGYSMNVRAT